MKLKVLGSSSSGNCYILDSGTEVLIIEAGVSIKDVKRAINWDLHKVVGCLITHQHNDHAKYIKAMVDNGFYTLALPEVWAAKNVQSLKSVSIVPGRGYVLGEFRVLPFMACHDVPCVGYVIDHPDSGKIMFLTDSCACDYRVLNLSHIMIECNYSHQALSDAIESGRTLLSQRARLLNSHMELSTCKHVLSTTNLSDVENIILVHLSENNADEQYFVSQIEKLTGKPVYAANRGLEIELHKL